MASQNTPRMTNIVKFTLLQSDINDAMKNATIPLNQQKDTINESTAPTLRE
jgi:hypothetical protein